MRQAVSVRWMRPRSPGSANGRTRGTEGLRVERPSGGRRGFGRWRAHGVPVEQEVAVFGPGLSRRGVAGQADGGVVRAHAVGGAEAGAEAAAAFFPAAGFDGALVEAAGHRAIGVERQLHGLGVGLGGIGGQIHAPGAVQRRGVGEGGRGEKQGES